MNSSKPTAATTAPLSATILYLSFFGLPAPAMAQDAQQVSPWSGFYTGANAGVTWSDSTGDVALNTTSSAPVATPPISPPSNIPVINQAAHFDSRHHTGFTGGVELGYNYVMANGLLLGIETDFNIYDITGNKTQSVQTPPIAGAAPYTYTASQKVDTDFLWTLRPRIGYATGKFLVFASGGLAMTSTKYKASIVDSRTPTQSVDFSRDSKSKTGWTIGAGAAYIITPTSL